MRKPVASLRKEIAKVRIDSAGRRRYDKKLRKRLVDFARAEQAQGQPIIKIAKELGIREQVLGTWLRSEERPAPIRAVEVVEERPASRPVPPSSPRDLRLRLPGGAVVEGLSLADVAQLLREAR